MHLKTKIDGMAMIIPLFTRRRELEEGKQVADAEIDKVFAKWVEPAAKGVASKSGAPLRRDAFMPSCAADDG